MQDAFQHVTVLTFFVIFLSNEKNIMLTLFICSFCSQNKQKSFAKYIKTDGVEIETTIIQIPLNAAVTLKGNALPFCW